MIFFAKFQTTKSPNMSSQNQTQSQNQNIPQQTSQSVTFNDQPEATLDRCENYPFFQQNKNITKKHHIRNQPHYSKDEEYYHQNQQRFITNQQNNNFNIDQPDPFYQQDLFEPYTRNEQRQTRHHAMSYNNSFQSQNPVSTQITNQLKCTMKSHYRIIYNYTKKQTPNLKVFLKYQMPLNHYK